MKVKTNDTCTNVKMTFFFIQVPIELADFDLMSGVTQW